MNKNWLDHIIWFCLNNKIIVLLMIVFFIGWGFIVAPFDWQWGGLERNPVPVDAIPDIGENQQIVFTEWPGRSPQDIEDQITYPLTVSLLGIPGVRTIRSYSMFGFSTIYVIFKENVEFYWSRSRVLEKLNSLSAGTLPQEVQPALGPDATALGQVFWYTLEGHDEQGNPTGGWDLGELRSIQDWYVRYALLSADGVSEVASIGGFVQEYQIDVDPDAMKGYNVQLDEVFMAVKMSNVDVGARTIEVNKVEYVIRGLGFIKTLRDIEMAVVKVTNNVPVYVKDVAVVTRGPALRRGALDKEGAEVVGGVVVVRYGDNPLSAIKNVKKKMKEISPGLPRKTLPDGTISQITIVPFYDRTGLIYETLGTLSSALSEEILITIIVILIMVMHIESSALISGLLPLAVLISFIAMKYFGVDANIVALSGIAIAIGTMVDMGIVICENILSHLDQAQPDEDNLNVVFRASREVAGAVLTAVSTTIVSFLPVFTMEAAEGKLFKPLAFTKTFALLASVFVALTIIPPLAHILFPKKRKHALPFHYLTYGIVIALGLWIAYTTTWWAGVVIIIIALYRLLRSLVPVKIEKWSAFLISLSVTAIIAVLLTDHWLPLGPEKGMIKNLTFVLVLIGGILLLLRLFQIAYIPILRWCLRHKILFLSIPVVIVLAGLLSWLGFNKVLGWLPANTQLMKPFVYLSHNFPGLKKEFMPSLDEGSYLFMPTTMPHASIGEVLDVLQKQDVMIGQIPEVDSVVGKLGRAETPLDPAPVSMIETIINYKPKFIIDRTGKPLRFRFDSDETDYFQNEDGTLVSAGDGLPYRVQGRFLRDAQGRLIPDPKGKPFQLWRPPLSSDFNPGRKAWKGINSPDDIWDAIVRAAEIPGTTSAPKLQPIAARIVMLQSGMRAPLGVKVKGPDLESIEKAALEIEKFLKQVPSIEPSAVLADRIVGKPYLEIKINRLEIARYGISVRQIQEVIEVAIGGKTVTMTVEGRQRYPVRVRYLRELRDNREAIEKILVPTSDGTQIPLIQLVEIEYVRGPQVIKSEDTFLIGYVIFDKKTNFSEVEVVEQARKYLNNKIAEGMIHLPPGVSFTFAGSYENQVRSEKKLIVVLPLALFIIFIILYLQFKSLSTTALIFSGILVAWSGGFTMIWLYSQPWFLDFTVYGTSMRDLFQVHTINLSVAVWVGFLALFGIATDDGVVMATYLDTSFSQNSPQTIQEIRDTAVKAGSRRVRAALMTTATTILALIPVLTSQGRGADIMVPMAIPSFGGMVIEVITMLIVPVLYCAVREVKFKGGG